jgi:hypothetical protein
MLTTFFEALIQSDPMKHQNWEVENCCKNEVSPVSSRLMPDVFRKKTGTYGFHVGLGELDDGSTIPLFSDTGYTFRDATFHGFYDCLEIGSLIWACSIHGTSLQSSTIFAEVSAWGKKQQQNLGHPQSEILDT